MTPMLQNLFKQWHPSAVAGTVPQNAKGAGEPMRQITLPDRSASVSLPASWQVLPGSGGGTILAQGPHKEQVALGFPLLAMNINDPAAQSAMRYGQGAGRNTLYGQMLYYPYGGDLAKTYVDLLNMFRRQHGLGPAQIQVNRQTPIPAKGERCALLNGTVNTPEDDAGTREMTTIFCSAPPVYGGSFLNGAAQTAVPIALAEKERGVMGAILASYQPNMGVVQGQANAIAAPTIAAIHEIGKQSEIMARSADDTRISMRQSYEHTQDVQDRAMQAYSNTFRENSVVLDKWNNAHGTLDNGGAEALVQSDPSRFEYVNAPNYWKGIDY